MPLPQTSTNQLLAAMAETVAGVAGIRSVSSTFSGLVGPDQQPHASLWISSQEEERKAFGGFHQGTKKRESTVMVKVTTIGQEPDVAVPAFRILIDNVAQALRGNQRLQTVAFPIGTPEVLWSGETQSVTFDVPRAAVEGQGVYLHAEIRTTIHQEFQA